MFNYVKKILLLSVACSSILFAAAPAVRLEPEWLENGKLVVHNYGHGNAGLLFSWGCAAEVVNIVSQLAMASAFGGEAIDACEARSWSEQLVEKGMRGEKQAAAIAEISEARALSRVLPEFSRLLCSDDVIAVIGNDINAMSAALVLHKFGYKVNLYSDMQIRSIPLLAIERQKEELFLPADNIQMADSAMFERIYRFTQKCMRDIHEKKTGLGGIYLAKELCRVQADIEAAAADDVILARGYGEDEFKFACLKPVALVDIAAYTADLVAQMRKAGIHFTIKHFDYKEELWSLSENIIINCSGGDIPTFFVE